MTARHDPDHEAVCDAQGRHHLVVAPPGTGKTFLSVKLAGRIAPQLDSVERVLLLTFSNQARIQLEREAARQLAPDARRRIEVCNYHSFFWREVWSYRRALGLPLDAGIGTSRRRKEALRRVDSQAVDDLKPHPGLLDSLCEWRHEAFRDNQLDCVDSVRRLLPVVEAELRSGRLLFDDLGALFWTLVETYPVLKSAYQRRYPIVIADEHQDASALQDAVVRRLSRKRLVVLADPMQLIYGFRGSRPERLQCHLDEADSTFELHTPHRWHGREDIGHWLLAVRKRLSGNAATAPVPSTLRIESCQYLNQMKARLKHHAVRALNDGLDTVAVLLRTNDEAHEFRNYLCTAGLYPRQIGGGSDFEEAHDDLEQLPLLTNAESVAHRAIERTKKLVPTLSSATVDIVKRRLGAHGVDLRGRIGAEAQLLLRAIIPIYEQGPAYYFKAIVALLDTCTATGHHLPRLDAVRALRSTADAGTAVTDVDDVLRLYAQNVALASEAAPRFRRGVYVMTAHQAKGREFDMVIIVNVAARHYPDNEDGRRLFYVAVTRATRSWTVITPSTNPSPLVQLLHG